MKSQCTDLGSNSSRACWEEKTGPLLAGTIGKMENDGIANCLDVLYNEVELSSICRNISMNQYTSFLFSEPSFIEGMARVLDMGNTLSMYNTPPSPQDADFWAWYSDYAAIGEDMRLILEQADEPQEQAQQAGSPSDNGS